ncbi:MAG: hypothetical protein V3V08_13255 [Nannocystaceae bacterium]
MNTRQTYSLLAFLGATPLAGCTPTGASTHADGAGGAQNFVPCGPDASILDAENNKDQVSLKGGRSGWLYSFVDETGTTITPGTDNFTLSPGGANGSAFAARFNGKLSAASEVYAGFGFGFKEKEDESYDASKYAGVSFFAKAAPGSTTRIRVKVPDINTDPHGKVCGECYNDFGIELDLTQEWTQYVVPFAETRQEEGWGAPRTAAIDPSKLFGIQFMVATGGVDFDIWIDDVAFACTE